jgi:hypothetical protein
MRSGEGCLWAATMQSMIRRTDAGRRERLPAGKGRLKGNAQDRWIQHRFQGMDI